MRVQTLAAAANVTADTVRHYTRIGLLTPVKNPANGYKEYTSERSTATIVYSPRP